MRRISKVFIIALIIAALASVVLPAQDTGSGWDHHFTAGDLSLSAGIGLSSGWGFGLSAYPGVELILSDIKLGEHVPLSFGVAGKGLVTFYSGYFADSGMAAAVGGFGTVHLGFKNFVQPWEFLTNFDVYVGLGLVFDLIQPTGWWVDASRLRFASFQGTNYFLSDTFAVFAESTYMGRYSYYGTFGALWKSR